MSQDGIWTQKLMLKSLLGDAKNRAPLLGGSRTVLLKSQVYRPFKTNKNNGHFQRKIYIYSCQISQIILRIQGSLEPHPWILVTNPVLDETSHETDIWNWFWTLRDARNPSYTTNYHAVTVGHHMWCDTGHRCNHPVFFKSPWDPDLLLAIWSHFTFTIMYCLCGSNLFH